MIRYRPNCSGSRWDAASVREPERTSGATSDEPPWAISRASSRGLVREAAEVVFEGGRGAELAADLVLGLDQVGRDVAGAAQLGELARGTTRG